VVWDNVKSFIFVEHYISCILMVWQSTNLRPNEIRILFSNIAYNLKSTNSIVHKLAQCRQTTKFRAHKNLIISQYIAQWPNAMISFKTTNMIGDPLLVFIIIMCLVVQIYGLIARLKPSFKGNLVVGTFLNRTQLSIAGEKTGPNLVKMHVRVKSWYGS